MRAFGGGDRAKVADLMRCSNQWSSGFFDQNCAPIDVFGWPL
jgi:hypothetical protein